MAGYNKKNVITLGIIAAILGAFDDKNISARIVKNFTEKLSNVTIDKKSVDYWIAEGQKTAEKFISCKQTESAKIFRDLKKSLMKKNALQCRELTEKIFAEVYQV